MELKSGEVIKAAKAWWRHKRPLSYTRKQHLDNPTINTCTDAEKRLARAVAQLQNTTPRRK